MCKSENNKETFMTLSYIDKICTQNNHIHLTSFDPPLGGILEVLCRLLKNLKSHLTIFLLVTICHNLIAAPHFGCVEAGPGQVEKNYFEKQFVLRSQDFMVKHFVSKTFEL